jgi:NADH dehydrogenase
MFGPDDAFLTVIIRILRWLPVYPLFGSGQTRLQPAHVEDVGDAIARALQDRETRAMTFECGGAHVYTYEQLVRTVAHEMERKPVLIPVPFAAWHGLAGLCEILPGALLTRNQVELMEIDNIVRPDMPGFDRLGVTPRSVEQVLPSILHKASVQH